MAAENTDPLLKKRTVMLTDQLIADIQKAAKLEGREFSAQVRWMLERQLKSQAAAAGLK